MPSPNILIFMTDHQRGDTVLPEHPVVKPNLSRFVRDGVAFTNAYCPSPHCCPSRATFMTGLYPSRHGVWNNVCNGQRLSRGLNPGVRCWSEDLHDAGYRLAWTGKWHVSIDESPKDRGFEELGVPPGRAANEHGTQWEHYQRVAQRPEPTERGEGEILRPGYGTLRLYGTREERAGEHSDQQCVGRAIEAMPRLAASGQPWCLYVGVSMPHDPYVVPRRYLDLYRLADVPLPPSYADPMHDKPRIVQRQRRQIFDQLSPREVREAIRHFWALCTYLDDLFGQLLAALEATGQARDTLVLYCADHGDYCGDHGLFAKGIACYRGAYHVPAVVRWPGGVERPGRRADHFVSLADFAPTLTELCGRTPDPGLTGRSLVSFLRDQPPPADWRDEIQTQCNGVELYYTQRSVMTADRKYVFNGFDDDELYDLRADPHEMVNRAHDPAYEPAKRQMCRRLWRFARREHDAAINGYTTVGLAPYGPAEALRPPPTESPDERAG